MKVTATAPTRVDLAGGTLDLWPIHNLLPKKATVNVAIDLNATATVELSNSKNMLIVSKDLGSEISGEFDELNRTHGENLLWLLVSAIWEKDLPAIRLTTSAKSPAGAGLGGSSCLAVTVLKALITAKEQVTGTRAQLTEDFLVRCAQDVESLVIHAPTGIQDYWGAIRGGLNVISYPYGGSQIQTFHGPIWQGQGFSILCCYSGKSRASAINNWEIFKRLFDGDKSLLQKMIAVGEESANCALAIQEGLWSEAIKASHREWKLRQALWPNIETTETKSIDSAARSAGAVFTRVCGAGGGGVMAAFTPTDRVSQVASAMREVGGQVLEVQLGGPGLTILENS